MLTGVTPAGAVRLMAVVVVVVVATASAAHADEVAGQSRSGLKHRRSLLNSEADWPTHNEMHNMLDPMSVVMDETAMIMRDDAMFVHIPKTGGTAMETKYKLLGRTSAHSTIRNYKKDYRTEHGKTLHSECEGAGQEFHMTLEQIIKCRTPEAIQKVYRGKEIFCLIREPVDRLLSEMRWQAFNCYDNYEHTPSCAIKDRVMNKVLRHIGYPEWHFDKKVKKMDPKEAMIKFAKMVAAFVEAQPRELYGVSKEAEMNEAMLHLQPQYWYVFDSQGRQTCHKTILYEEWDFDIRERQTQTEEEAAAPDHSIPDELRQQLKGILYEAYKHDFLMYEELKALWSRRDELAAEAGVDMYSMSGHLQELIDGDGGL